MRLSVKAGDCKALKFLQKYMHNEQLLRMDYEAGTKEGPNLLGRFPGAIAECSESMPLCNCVTLHIQ